MIGEDVELEDRCKMSRRKGFLRPRDCALCWRKGLKAKNPGGD